MHGGEGKDWRKRLLATARNIQRFVGGVMALYGLFVLADPSKYATPLLSALSVQQQGLAGFVLFIVGLVLFFARKPILDL
jgi:hypothetical protein